MKEKIVGVIGGMGPEATADFFARVVALTPAKKDQEHLRIIIDNNPKIPDRTESILSQSDALFPVLLETARNLEKAGVDFIVIPCNTVHYYYEDLCKELSVPVLHMLREVVLAALTSHPKLKQFGILATTGTVESALYQREFEKAGCEIVVPDPKTQKAVMDAILSIKHGEDKKKARRKLLRLGNKLITDGAEALIFGCTEVGLVLSQHDFSVPVFDSTQVLAEATVRFAIGQGSH